jgi:DNA ligase-4
MMNMNLSARKKLLKKVIVPERGRLEIVEGIESTTVEDIQREFNEAVARNEEGIIIKELETLYYPN